MRRDRHANRVGRGVLSKALIDMLSLLLPLHGCAAMTTTTTSTPSSRSTVPSFPSTFYSGELIRTFMNQGGYREDLNTACCAVRAPNCKVTTDTSGQDYREDAKMNRSRTDSAQGAVVKWYQIASPQFPHDGMTMQVVPAPAGSKHKWTCAAYCPLQGATFTSHVVLGDKESGPMGVAKDLGRATVTQAPPASKSAECEHYRWKEGLAAPKHNWSFVMSVEDFYATRTTPPVPWFHKTTIEPAGQYLGEQNVSFLGFEPLNVSDYFDVDPDSMKHCKPSTQCNEQGDEEDDEEERPFRARMPKRRSYLELAREQLATAATSGGASSPSTSSGRALSEHADVDTPLNYVSEEYSTTLIAQGGAKAQHPGGDTCCDIRGAGCQVQQQHFDGVRYFDWENQRQRVEDHSAGQTIVDLYDKGVSMLVVNVSGVETCKEYCPITLEDDMEPLTLPKKAQYKGETIVEQQKVTEWQWSDVVFKVVPMQTYKFYGANRTVPKWGDDDNVTYCLDRAEVCTVPVYSTSALTPFGQEPPIGFSNVTWKSLKMQMPPPAKFAIAGIDTCPQSASCGSSSRQAHRLASKQLHTFYHYLKQV